MIELLKEEMNCLYSFVEGKSDVELWACIEGNMGRAWVDKKDKPNYAIIVVADFCYLLGSGIFMEDESLVKEILTRNKGKIIVADDFNWISFIEKHFPDNLRKFSRYAIKIEPDIFKRDVLENYISNVEDQFKIEKINESNYYKVLEDKFMEDCCSFFSSLEDYLEHGIGYIIMHDGEIIAGASSYSYCKGSLDITIGTKEEYRRRGLAAACASKLILDCLERNIYPRWDAANQESVVLAEKLGYNFDKEYIVYSIR